MPQRPRYLLDSGILIRHLRGKPEAVNLLRALGRQERLAISAVTRLELHAGLVESERFRTQKLVSRLVTFAIDAETADRAGDWIRQSRQQGKMLSVPDAIIAATALLQNLTLVTLNPKDFAVSGLRLFPIDSSRER